MPSFSTLLPLVALATAVQSFVTVPLNPITGREGAYLKGLPEANRQRAAALKSGKSATAPASNLAYVQYTTSVGVGNPPTYYNLVVDTGSSNTFVGTGKKYVRTNTSVSTNENVNVTYGQGFFTGKEYIDQVTLAPGLVIKNQSIGDALKFAYFDGVDGIVGVGPVDLTTGTLAPDENEAIPTVLNNALKQGLIEEEILGVSFKQAGQYNDTNGALTYGGIDSSLYTGDLTYTPLTKTEPANYYWGINITKATFGKTSLFDKSYAGIVDTGTTQVLIADDFFAKYTAAIPGSYQDNNTGLIVIPPASVSKIQNLTLEIGGKDFVLDVGAQLIPQDENEAWGGENGTQYGVVGGLGSPSGEGLDFIVGQTFLERYYSVYDAKNGRVGFAYTNHTWST
ncbi:acid protease [Coniophora puteana RWD-64-598 SS2]|uniref:Acid protease n=1 Tax=Coniophora puteana (strain RWD-64-598) TaxID=741705 RepID=A0A5M3N2J5_CONPW|nr:acid protease [Coniophora puteana RWD-64-598 SS2]EIW85612.1 acid protease [Coniophora puteana RWD-64-598 SS2]